MRLILSIRNSGSIDTIYSPVMYSNSCGVGDGLNGPGSAMMKEPNNSRFAPDHECMKPLPTTHPELEIHKNLPLSIEYRVRNRKLAKDGSGRVLLGYGYSTWDLVVALLIWIIWNRSQVGVFFSCSLFVSDVGSLHYGVYCQQRSS